MPARKEINNEFETAPHHAAQNFKIITNGNAVAFTTASTLTKSAP
jgi:hypothetical protein